MFPTTARRCLLAALFCLVLPGSLQSAPRTARQVLDKAELDSSLRTLRNNPGSDLWVLPLLKGYQEIHPFADPERLEVVLDAMLPWEKLEDLRGMDSFAASGKRQAEVPLTFTYSQMGQRQTLKVTVTVELDVQFRVTERNRWVFSMPYESVEIEDSGMVINRNGEYLKKRAIETMRRIIRLVWISTTRRVVVV
ncbi:MAG TPA: hypothetical protein VK188_14470 [Holophaga sp.]|nr:hypothetical protein [Holophaga sp.]